MLAPPTHPETIDLNEHIGILADSEQCQNKHCMCEDEVDSDLLSDANSDYDDYDSDKDPEFSPGACEVRKCKVEVWAACPECEMMLCYDHFNEEVVSCFNHGRNTRKPKRKRKHAFDKDIMTVSDTDQVVRGSDKGKNKSFPEDYTVEGVEKEGVQKKKARVNTRKEEKKKKDLGQEYTSTKTKKTMPAKCVKPRCKGTACTKQQKLCESISDEQRQVIFESFHALGDLKLQREFLVRHIKCSEKKRSYTKGESRRKNSNEYSLRVGEESKKVCKLFFFNTLGISEQMGRTAQEKITPTGTLEKDKRGGRQSAADIERDQLIQQEISDHIDRFPRVESHYCRASSTREYLSSELTKKRMYNMFIQEWIPKARPPSLTTYKKVLRTKNLSIHHPKKDQCSLCINYLKGTEETKSTLKDRYEIHEREKIKVREIKDQCKNAAKEDKEILCGSFDLQQVIYLPMSMEGSLFYKRRLSMYNLTFYNIGDKACHCFAWDETQSKRGSSEIATSVYRALKFYDEKGIKKAYLFSDGCSGQNKNSIMPAMMLYTITNSAHMEEISLRFFETNHGQNEGDSAHSAIGRALKQAGDLFLPSQVATVMSLARPQNPYLVDQMAFKDFLDFKGFSKELRILESGRASGSQEDHFGGWSNIMELKVTKQDSDKIFYKMSHSDIEYKIMSLKRLQKRIKDVTLKSLNTDHTNISREKYTDLQALCSGTTPVVKMHEHKAYYMSLPHD